MVVLLPRLAGPAADQLLGAFLSSPAAWQGFDPNTLPDAVRFAATGGARVRAAELQALRQGLLALATSSGLGAPPTRQATSRFDAEAAAWLSQQPLLSSGEALRDDVWTFMTVVVSPDIVHWRFGESAERYLGGIRNTFQRLWMRGRVFDRQAGDRWGLLRDLTEDAMVQITERPSIGGDPALARALAEAWVRGAAHHGRSAMEDIMRRAALRVRIWNELRSLTQMSPDALDRALDEAMELPSGTQASSNPAVPDVPERARPAEATANERPVDLRRSAEQLEEEARGHGLLSPKSRAALESVKAGKLPLTESESNALRHLIARIRELRAEKGPAGPAEEVAVVAAPSPSDGPARTRSKWGLWRRE